MFDFIRTHQRLMQLLLLLLIFPSFVFLGVESYSRFMGKSDDVAEVAGQRVSLQAYDQTLRDQIDRAKQMLGSSFDASIFDKAEIKQALLDNLIRQSVIANAVTKANLNVSDKHLIEVVQAIPAVQNLKKPDGTFDLDTLKMMLSAQGQSLEQFEAQIKRELLMQQVATTIGSSTLLSKQVASRLTQLNLVEYEVQNLEFKQQDYANSVDLDNASIKAEYDTHKDRYMTQESADVEYVTLTMDDIAKNVLINEAELQDFYNNNKARYQTEEERRVSHILINLSDNANETEASAAKAKADDLYQQIKRNPSDFEILAKKYSQDQESSDKGGDLGFQQKGSVGGAAFDEAMFKLSLNEVSEPLRTQFGYHLIKVTGIHPASVKNLNEVRSEVEREVRRQIAAKTYAESAEIFTNTVYEQSDSLKAVADKLKLNIQTVDNIGKKLRPEQVKLPINNDKLLRAIFSEDAAKNKRNTEAVEIAPNTLVAARVVTYRPAVLLPFDQASLKIKTMLLAEKALKAAILAGETKLAELTKSDSAAGFGDIKKISRVSPSDLSLTAKQAIFQAALDKLPKIVGVVQEGQGYMLYRIIAVSKAATPEKPLIQNSFSIYNRELAQEENEAYLRLLTQRSKVKVLKNFKAEPQAAS